MKHYLIGACCAAFLAIPAVVAPALAQTVATDAGQPDRLQLGELTIDTPFTRATLPGAPVAGGFMTILNAGDTPDRLVAVQTALAGRSEIHEMVMEGDVMRMRALPDGLEIPAGGSVELKPGSYHLMFLELKQPFVEGEVVPVTLTFQKAGAVDVDLRVGPPNARKAKGHAMPDAKEGGHGGH